MEDSQIVALFLERSEKAISAAAEKYGNYCRTIARSILYDDGESEECVNDALLQAWKSIPPHRPERLSTFLGKITRNLAINRSRHVRAVKRGSGQVSLALDELTECIPVQNDMEQAIEESVLTDILNRFLEELPSETRRIFMRRYWYLSPIKEIAADFGISESKVKMRLMRTRQKLRTRLEKEGFQI